MPHAMITDVEDFFVKGCGRCDRFATANCSIRRWLDGLLTLRRILREVGLTETAKWGHPCYMHAGRNIAILGAFRGDFRLTFFHASLLKDPECVLERQGPNSRHPDCLRFTDNIAPEVRDVLIRAYLVESMGYAKAGILPPKDAGALPLPDELVQALDIDPDLADAFHALTPGRQKSWSLHVNDAKVPATRISRIAKGRAKIIAGKGATER